MNFVKLSNIISLISSQLTSHKNLITYFFIGASASIIDVTGFYVFFSIFGIQSTLATTYSVTIAIVYAFLLNTFFNFKMTDRFFVRFLSYFAVSGMGLLLSVCMLWVLNVLLGFNGNLIKIFSLPMVFIIQYFLNKRITFRSFETVKIKE